ncbi:MAG: acyltransferase family protein [Sphingorhabdus sp.]
MNRTERVDLRPLTGLRGVAAWAVVFYHIRSGMGGYAPDWLIAAFAKGYLAVDLFFMLSGFVMWLTYGQRFADKGLQYSGEFLARRFARIWPLHALILCITCAFVLVLAATGRPFASGYPLSELPLHFTLTQNWGLTGDLSWNHPAWSISAELGAYLLFPFIALYARLDRLTDRGLIVVAILLAVGLHCFFRLQGYSTLGDAIPQTGLVRCILQFGIGMIVCILWQRWRRLEKRPALPCAILGAATMATSFFNLLPETLTVPIGFALLLLALALSAERTNNPLGNPVLHYLGEISYATYLVHFMAYIFFKILFVADPANVSPQAAALFVLIVLIASILLYHGIEKPAQRWLNNRLSRRMALLASTGKDTQTCHN